MTLVCFEYSRILLVFVCCVFVNAVVYVGVGQHFVPLQAVSCQHFLLVKLHAQWFSQIEICSIFSGSIHNKKNFLATNAPTEAHRYTNTAFKTAMSAHSNK